MGPKMPEGMTRPDWYASLRTNYEDLGREIQTNGTYAWTMGGIFFAAGLGIIGLILTRDTGTAPEWTQSSLGAFALTLAWSWLSLLFRLGDINAERYFVRSLIEKHLGLAEYTPEKPGRSRFVVALPAVFLHAFWWLFSLWLLPFATCSEMVFKIAWLVGLGGALLVLATWVYAVYVYRGAWTKMRENA